MEISTSHLVIRHTEKEFYFPSPHQKKEINILIDPVATQELFLTTHGDGGRSGKGKADRIRGKNQMN